MKQDAAEARDDARYTVRSIVRVLKVLDSLRLAPRPLSLPEVAERAGLPKSSAFRYLATLEQHWYVDRDPFSGSYRLGPALLSLHAQDLGVLAARARPYMEALRDRFQETINLGIFDGSRVVYLEIVETTRTMRLAARRGDHDPLHSTALGKI